MTLLEILVVMTIVGILLGPIMGVLLTNMQLNTRTKEIADAKSIATTVQKFIFDEIKFANSLVVTNSIPPSTTANIIYMDPVTGLTQYKSGVTRAIYGENLIKPYKMEIEFSKPTDIGAAQNSLNFRIKMLKSRMGNIQEIYITTASVRAINMNGNINSTPLTSSIIIYQIP